MPHFARWAVLTLTLTACAPRSESVVERLRGNDDDVSGFWLRSLQGTRDGERLDVRAVYGNGSRGLRVDLRFRVGPQTRLESGTWTGLGSDGQVKERSVTFLGGQSGSPSIGGRFDLLAPDGKPVYRVSIPLQELKNPL